MRSSDSLQTCIWCIRNKPVTAFNREHVIPECFGMFEDSFTLINTVCAECNGFFSRELELALARDSLEGYRRFHYGQKPTTEFKSLGKKSVSKVQLSEGIYAGAWGYAVAGSDEFGIRAFSQIGFSKAEEGPFEWFLLDDLPSPDDLKGKGYVGTCYVRFCECGDLPKAQQALSEKGFTSEQIQTFLPPSGRINVELVFRPGQLLQRRGLAKILFNYLAYHNGAAVALEERFDPIRTLVMQGVEPPYQYFAMDDRAIVAGDKTGKGRFSGHIAEVHSEDTQIIGTVSLYNQIRYQFRLARAPGSPIPPSGHLFDWKSRTIFPLTLKRSSG